MGDKLIERKHFDVPHDGLRAQSESAMEILVRTLLIAPTNAKVSTTPSHNGAASSLMAPVAQPESEVVRRSKGDAAALGASRRPRYPYPAKSACIRHCSDRTAAESKRMKNVLLIEDDVELAELIAVGLSDHGFEVEWASDGLEGLDRARSSRPDILIVDRL